MFPRTKQSDPRSTSKRAKRRKAAKGAAKRADKQEAKKRRDRETKKAERQSANQAWRDEQRAKKAKAQRAKGVHDSIPMGLKSVVGVRGVNAKAQRAAEKLRMQQKLAGNNKKMNRKKTAAKSKK